MSKRRVDDDFSKISLSKRSRTTESVHKSDRLSSLSNEILLHILSFLPIPALLTCQRLSHRFNALAGDSELWKRQYYSKWVRPRARRLASTRRFFLPQAKIEYSPRVSTWLDHGNLDRNHRITHWKQQYQLRHNWSKGTCRVTQVELPQPPRPPMLVTLCAGYVFTADAHGGLRAWSVESPETCKASLPFTDPKSSTSSAPTALTATCGSEESSIELAVGFDGGVFSVYKFDTKALRLNIHFTRTRSAHGAITAMAASYPYLMAVSKHKILSLYKLPVKADDHSWGDEAHILASLKADSILSPMSLSVRMAGTEIIASIVYSFLHLGCGWSLGIQELHFDSTGQQTRSRLTTTVDTQYGVHLHQLPGSGTGQDSTPENESPVPTSLTPTLPAILHQDPPTSVSYSHPYLLTSHADNTLTVYLVVSTPTALFVKGGQRLFGHTSSVSAVQVSDRGKAVSVSLNGDEIRVWELESLVSSFGSQKMLQGDNSIKIQPENQRGPHDHEGPGLLSGVPRQGTKRVLPYPANASHKLVAARGCIGFDDERLLLFREKEHGSQLLEFYDFR
ncbi:WD domain protein [Aspergillus stella-maris]|uniref:WD domain protein n=1 Tax=Aspergillus stella-maris TaxID=1810926 RepID=UPI003CCDADB1